jgi:plasmid maintenance system killer protein
MPHACEATLLVNGEVQWSKGFSLTRVTQWRICFRFVDGDAYDVEIADYH